jgi:cell division protein FtsB
MRRETKTWAGRLFAAALVAFVLAYVPYHLYARSGFARTLALRRDLAALRAHNREQAQENDRLAREAAALRDDAAAVERVARIELGWVKPAELVVVLEPEARP